MFHRLKRFAPFALFVLALVWQTASAGAMPILIGRVSPNPVYTPVNVAVYQTFSAILSGDLLAGQEMAGGVQDKWTIVSVEESADGSNFGSAGSDYTLTADGSSANIGTWRPGLSVIIGLTPLKAAYYRVTVNFEADFTNPSALALVNVPGIEVGMKLDIQYSGTTPTGGTQAPIIVTGQTQNIIVGQIANLTGVVTPAMGLTNVAWTIDPKHLQNWQGSATKSTPTPTDLTANPTKCFWYDAGNKTVTLSGSVLVNGVAIGLLPAQTTFNVLRPSHTITVIALGKVGADLDYGIPDANGTYQQVTVPTLHFGKPQLAHQGISFSASLDPNWSDGNPKQLIQWVQVVTTDRELTTASNGVNHKLQGTGLDTTYPYSTDYYQTDSPSISTQFGYQSYSDVFVNDIFQMWLMYKPSGGDSCWVPLRVTTWEWGGDATPLTPPSAYAWVLSRAKGKMDSEADTTSYPSWTQNVLAIAPMPGF